MLRPFVIALPALLISSACLGQPASTIPDRIRRVEQGLLTANLISGEPVRGMDLAERMRAYRVPGVSVAVINGGDIEWARGYGVTERGGTQAVDTGTLFQAASISKPVAAMAALRLVQSGRLMLDTDLNTILSSWRVQPTNGLTDERKVTLRGVLSHSAGLTVHGFSGYAAGEQVPTLQQVLDGVQPANSAPVRLDVAPGSIWRYSGGGYSVMQQALIDLVGRPFPAIMRELVLDPVGMRSSTYEQPLPTAWTGRAATGHRGDGTPVRGKWHTYPEMAAAGLWTTPSDLARLAVEVQRARRAASKRVLDTSMTRQMLTLQKGSYGLGFSLEGDGRDMRFSHGGANEGFRAFFLAFAETGQGAVIMTNSDNGSDLASEILRAISREYDWPAIRPAEKVRATVGPSRLRDLAGRYELVFGRDTLPITITIARDTLRAELPIWAEARVLHPSPDARFFTLESSAEFTFERDSAGVVRQLLIGGMGMPIRARRVR